MIPSLPIMMMCMNVSGIHDSKIAGRVQIFYGLQLKNLPLEKKLMNLLRSSLDEKAAKKFL
jgi:hypothetical protein